MRISQTRLTTTGALVYALVLSACAPGFNASTGSRSSASLEEEIPIIPRSSNSPNLNICSASTTVPGIDVSAWQGNINWPQVRLTGKDFVFIKATEGDSYISPPFASDWDEARDAGILRGAYHFFRPSADPVAQAELFLNTMGALGLEDMPAVLDWEVTDGVSPSLQIQRAKIWLDIVEAATGKIPIIYTGPSFWNQLGNPEEFVRYSLFIANYEVMCPWIPAPWSEWTFWQQGDNGAVGGISGNTDINVFNGDLAELKRFARRGR